MIIVLKHHATRADADELMAALARRPGVRYPVLVPNMRGMARAEAAGSDATAVFTAASDAFTTRNIRMTVAESLGLKEAWLAAARNCVIASIGPTATEHLIAEGLPPDLEPEHPKMGQLVKESLERGALLLQNKRGHA